jgi:hypothetical protein
MYSQSEATSRSVDRPSWLADESRFWLLISAGLGAVAALKGLHRPGTWTATQTQFDYRFGFIRRGLLGQILSWLHVPANSYAVFVAVAFILLIAVIIVLIRWVWISGVFQKMGRGAAVALFFTSYAVTYLTNLVGYTDIPLLGLALLVIGVRHDGARLLAVVLAGVVGILVHESYLLLFFPVTLLPSILRAAPVQQPAPAPASAPARRLALIAAAAAGIGIFTICVALQPSMTPQQLVELQHDVEARVDFPARRYVFEVLLHSTKSNVLVMLEIMRHGRWWVSEVYALLAFGPTAAILLWLSFRGLATGYRGPYPKLVRACVLGASFSPALMQFLGWDLFRWYALVVIDSMLCLCIISRYCLTATSAAVELLPGQRNLIILIIALNLATGRVGTYETEPFPFMGHFNSLRQWQHDHWKLAPPGG